MGFNITLPPNWEKDNEMAFMNWYLYTVKGTFHKLN